MTKFPKTFTNHVLGRPGLCLEPSKSSQISVSIEGCFWVPTNKQVSIELLISCVCHAEILCSVKVQREVASYGNILGWGGIIISCWHALLFSKPLLFCTNFGCRAFNQNFLLFSFYELIITTLLLFSQWTLLGVLPCTCYQYLKSTHRNCLEKKEESRNLWSHLHNHSVMFGKGEIKKFLPNLVKKS